MQYILKYKLYIKTFAPCSLYCYGLYNGTKALLSLCPSVEERSPL